MDVSAARASSARRCSSSAPASSRSSTLPRTLEYLETQGVAEQYRPRVERLAAAVNADGPATAAASGRVWRLRTVSVDEAQAASDKMSSLRGRGPRSSRFTSAFEEDGFVATVSVEKASRPKSWRLPRPGGRRCRRGARAAEQPPSAHGAVPTAGRQTRDNVFVSTTTALREWMASLGSSAASPNERGSRRRRRSRAAPLLGGALRVRRSRSRSAR